MPIITCTKLEDGKILILKMKENFYDYTSMATLPNTCWHALKDAYENRLIFK